jgi:hypothetical protein
MSTQRLYIVLGRAGDILNFLPVLKREADEGRRAALMTTAPFTQLLEGVSYADCIEYAGKPGDISGAVEAAKKLSSEVKVVQVAGPPDEIKKHSFEKAECDSWAKEIWRLSGHMAWWKDNLPLVFDKRDTAREDAICPDYLFERKPTILVSTGGVSSPFHHKKILMTALRLRFKTGWKILDLGTVKAHRLYDLLGIMEKARFLVTTDSAPLHLARAVPTLPVIALQADSPGLWNGSPWRPEHIWNCRYRDFPRRWPSMIEAMDNLYHGPLAFNPCRTREGVSFLHVFSAYEGIPDAAKKNWQEEYEKSPRYVHCPVWYGMCGRDSSFLPGERLRFPYVKDVIRCALARAKTPDDLVILTRADTCFGTGDNIWGNWPGGPIFSHRAIRDGDSNLTHHPAIDHFGFTKTWWETHAREYPDMIMGRDYFWQRTLKALILRHGGREVPWLTYQAKEDK